MREELRGRSVGRHHPDAVVRPAHHVREVGVGRNMREGDPRPIRRPRELAHRSARRRVADLRDRPARDVDDLERQPAISDQTRQREARPIGGERESGCGQAAEAPTGAVLDEALGAVEFPNDQVGRLEPSRVDVRSQERRPGAVGRPCELAVAGAARVGDADDGTRGRIRGSHAHVARRVGLGDRTRPHDRAVHARPDARNHGNDRDDGRRLAAQQQERSCGRDDRDRRTDGARRSWALGRNTSAIGA